MGGLDNKEKKNCSFTLLQNQTKLSIIIIRILTYNI